MRSLSREIQEVGFIHSMQKTENPSLGQNTLNLVLGLFKLFRKITTGYTVSSWKLYHGFSTNFTLCRFMIYFQPSF